VRVGVSRGFMLDGHYSVLESGRIGPRALSVYASEFVRWFVALRIRLM